MMPNRSSPPPVRIVFSWMVLCVLLPCLPGGCSPAGAPRFHLRPEVERPPAAVVLISVDGFAVDRFEAFLEAGDLPNIRRVLVDGGVRVRRAVAAQPTITYASFTTILTGRYPGSHGVVGNKWFDRYALVHRNYATIATYRWVGNDYTAPTLFEHLAPRRTVNIQNANRRGASRTVDNWMSSGVFWFFGAFESVDALIPRRLEEVAESANKWGDWPVFIHAYMPAVDERGHQHGADSPEYRRAAMNVDRQVGRLVAGIEAAGMLERTFFVLISDHGHVPTAPAQYFNLAEHLRGMGMAVGERPFVSGSFEERKRHFETRDAVVIEGGDRRAIIHLPGPGGWHERPRYETVAELVDPRRADGGSLWTNGTVKLIMAPRRWADGHRTVEVYSRSGHSRLSRRQAGAERWYGYEVVTTDALNGAVPPGERDAESWLALTVDRPLPDFVVPMFELFESPRAGDIMLVAEKGWQFIQGRRGGHGGVDPGDVLVPMVFAGPGLPAGASIDQARLVDVAPTILGLLGINGESSPRGTFDGVDRSAELRAARPR